jgi:hypothetical protein
MIDKDLNQQKVLTETFLRVDSNIFYCKFHVIQIFERKFKTWHPQIYSLLVQMIDASSEEAFNNLLIDFTALAQKATVKDSKLGKTVLDYFNDNWLNCLNMWVKFYKYPSCSHLNDTNNPIESINRVLKRFIPNAGSMFDCLRGIFDLLSDAKIKYFYNNFKYGKLTKYKGLTDQVIDKIYQIASKRASEILVNQYVLSSSMVYLTDKINENEYELRSKSNVSRITNNLTCSCAHFIDSGSLPCRHLFYLRAELELEVIESSMIPLCWTKHESDLESNLERPLPALICLVEAKPEPKLVCVFSDQLFNE